MKMSCKQIICIERIINLQYTYTVLNLTLSELIENIIKDIERENLKFIDIKVLMYVLKNVPFDDEQKAFEILKDILYFLKKKKFCKFLVELKALHSLILGEYLINGSIIEHKNDRIRWDLDIALIVDGKVVRIDDFH
jgi:hypothetical protein